MERKPVNSSTVKSIGYEDESKILEVEFLSGSVYQYFSVPIDIYEKFVNARSHGEYFNKNIKNVYGFKQIK